MEVRVNYNAYNFRRFGKPWISKVTAWPVGGKPIVEFGTYIGDDGGGVVTISAEAGDIIRHGQKDTRQTKNNTYDWYVVQPDASLKEIDVKEARDVYLKKAKAEPVKPQAAESVEGKARGLIIKKIDAGWCVMAGEKMAKILDTESEAVAWKKMIDDCYGGAE